MLQTIMAVAYMMVTGDYPGHAVVGYAEDSALVDFVFTVREVMVLR